MRTNQGRRGTLEADLERGGIGAGLAPLHVKAVDPRGGGATFQSLTEGSAHPCQSRGKASSQCHP